MLVLRSSLLALLVVAACAGDTTISLADFDTSCVQDQDCVIVQVGDVCGCDCGNAAINAKSLGAYQTELAARAAHCTSRSYCDCVIAPPPACTAGRCVLMGP